MPDNKEGPDEARELLVVEVPADMKMQFKLLCTEAKLPMTQVLLGLIELIVTKQLEVRKVAKQKDDSPRDPR